MQFPVRSRARHLTPTARGAILSIGAAAVIGSCAGADRGPTGPVTPPVDPNDPAFQRSSHVVAVDGRAANTGDLGAPWDLATALQGASGRVTPGDTIWVRGGTYRGSFTSRVAGSASAPILVRAMPSERAIIEHAGSAPTTLGVQGGWITFWGLEITNGDGTRSTSSTASEMRPNGIVNNASNTRYVDMIVHDAGVGFYNYASTTDVEVYGSIFYNNGWQAPDRGHGHAFYVKSDAGPITLRHNVIFNQFGWGVHAFSNAGSGHLNNIRVAENISFGNGTLASTPSAENILLGGLASSTGSSVTGNLTWFAAASRQTNVRIGYGSTENGTVSVTGNTFAGGDPVLRIGRWSQGAWSGNALAGGARIVQLSDTTLAGLDWQQTQQLRDPLSPSWGFGDTYLPFAVWTATTGLGLTDIVGAARPTTPEVHVLPHAYEGGRAFVVIYNWPRTASVTVPLTGILAPGEAFEIHNVQDLFGAPVLTGTNEGAVTLPMSGVAPPVPIGLPSSRASRTGPEFDVFVIRRR